MAPLQSADASNLLSSLGPDVDDGDAPPSIATLKANLVAMRKEQVRLEERQAERDAQKKQLAEIEAQAAAARTEEAALRKKFDSASGGKSSKLAAAEQQRGRWVDPAKSEPVDEETQHRATMQLKRRKQALTRLLAALRDAETTAREEDTLRQLNGELAKLQKSRHGLQRELSQCMKQVDASRAQVAALRGSVGALDGGSADRPAAVDPEQREEQEEEYLRRLNDVVGRMSAASATAVGANAIVKAEWESWFEALSSCARRLQARADAGADDAVALPEGGGEGGGGMSTPAFRVLELVRTLSTKHAELRKRVADSTAQEKELEAKLTVCRERAAAQHIAIKHATQQTARILGERAIRAKAAMPAAAEAEAPGLPPLA